MPGTGIAPTAALAEDAEADPAAQAREAAQVPEAGQTAAERARANVPEAVQTGDAVQPTATDKAEEAQLPTLGGSFRTLTSALIEPSSRAEPRVHGLTQNLLRLTAEGPLGADALRLQLHGVQYVSFGTAFGVLTPNAPQRYRVFRDDEAWLESGDALAFTYLDRANLKYSAENWYVTLGRQAINFAKSYFWSALDIYRPFPPWVFDRDYKPGVDALRWSAALSETDGVEAVIALGRTLFVDPTTSAVRQEGGFADLSYYGSSALLRGYATFGDVDVTLQAGKVYGGRHAGVSLAANWNDFGFYAEAAGVLADGLPEKYARAPLTGAANRDLVTSHATAVAGVQRAFDNGFSFIAEYAYNGGGDSRDFASGVRRTSAGQVVNINEHLAGLMLSYEVTPLLKVNGTAIVAPREPSALLSPLLTYSISDDTEVLAGAIFSTGARPYPDGVPRSEFGTYNHIVYAEWKVHF